VIKQDIPEIGVKKARKKKKVKKVTPTPTPTPPPAPGTGTGTSGSIQRAPGGSRAGVGAGLAGLVIAGAVIARRRRKKM
jgi:hypothetical protein